MTYLNKYTGGYSLGEWISYRLEELYSHNMLQSIPVKLDPLLKKRKIHWPPEYSSTVQRGALKPIRGGFKLIIGNQLRYAPRLGELRFTIAHELGHTFFYSFDSETPHRFKNVPPFSKEEETLCERFAAELLMPMGHVIKWYEKGRAKSITECIVEFAKQFEVSTVAAARRLVDDLALWPGIVIGCQVQNTCTATDSPEVDARIIWAVNSQKLGEKLYIPQASMKRKGLAKVVIPGMNAILCRAERGKSVTISVLPERVRIPGNFSKHIEAFKQHKGDILVECIKIGASSDKSQLAYLSRSDVKSTCERIIIAIPEVRSHV